MPQYLVRNIKTQEIKYAVLMSLVDPNFNGPSTDEHPPTPLEPDCEPGCELLEWAGDLSFFNAQPTATSVLHWNGANPVWVETGDLDAQRARAVDAMSRACGNAITAGFVSSALGAVYSYPAKPTDQANLSGSVLASILPAASSDWTTPFWCADAAGAWEFRAHTAAQIQQVGVDAKVAILNCMTINEGLRAQIMVADADQLATIVWPA